MATIATAVLLAAALGGLVGLRRVGFALPPVLAGVAVASNLLPPHDAVQALRPLAAPLAFVLLAVPLAVLLDEIGFFEELARLVGGTRHYLGAGFVLAAAVTALLNLDAAVVMLTPLYVRLARRRRVAPIVLAIQPLLLSCLASSALPISNLTNLVAAPVAHLSTAGFLVHLGPPTLAATLAGWWAYRRLLESGRLAGSPAPEVPAPPEPSAPAPDTRVLVLGGLVVAACVTGFLTVGALGGQPYEVAAGGDLVLVALARRLPWRVVPWTSIATVCGLGVLAAALAAHLPVDALLGGGSLTGMLRDVGVLAGGGNLVNNLPALLVALHRLPAHGKWESWAALLGDNVAPLALPTGTLAGLLWLETVRRLGVDFAERDYLRCAWRVALPATVAGTIVLVGLRALLGAGG